MELASDVALRGHFLYGRVLSSDLRGHLLVQMGKTQVGLRVLKEAETLSHQIGNRGVAQAIEISRANYEAQFGIVTADQLERKVKTSSQILDSYSHSSLLLELARQHLLRGSFDEASATLDQAAEKIYSHQNRRQEVTLNLRYAYLYYLKNEPARALNFIQSCKRALDPVVDHTLKLSILGMERKIVGVLKIKDRAVELEQQIERESILFGGLVHQRIVGRQRGEVLNSTLNSFDPLGRVMDLVAGKPPSATAIETICRSGYLGLLLEVLPDALGHSLLYIDLDESTLTAVGSFGVEHHRGLTTLLRRILMQLAKGPRSKSELVTSVWRYSAYHPLQHDPVVYQAITALRKLLGTRSSWIETTETGYRLASGVQLRFAPEASDTSEPRLEARSEAKLDEATSSHKQMLNHRQIKFIRQLKEGEFVGVHDYKRRFRISEITACRDLSLLVQSGLVLKVGRARATKYAKRGKGL
jgi:DNA-binding winged helix-turn-helix (wHTH) protein